MTFTLPPFRQTDLAEPDRDSGPADVQCKECGLLCLPLETENYCEPMGDGTFRVIGGTENWYCLNCWRRITVRWCRPREKSGS